MSAAQHLPHAIDSLLVTVFPAAGPAGSAAENSGRPSPLPISAPSKFVLTAIDDVVVGASPAWAINGLLPARGLAVIIGAPKAGKSFLASDAFFAVARGATYAGRNTLQGPVVYCTGEGVNGFKARLVAMRHHYKMDGQKVPFHHVDRVPDLGSDRTDVGDLIDDIRRQLHGEMPRAVVLDTLARCMAGGDENSARDMGRFVARCSEIERAFECVVVVVHHTGKDESRGARGSNALLGALDCEWTVEKTGDLRSARVSRMKDGQDDIAWSFHLNVVPVPVQTDAYNDAVCAHTTCVVEILAEAREAQTTARRKKQEPKGLKRDLLNIIRQAVVDAGQSHNLPATVPPNTLAISRAVLKEICVKKAWLDEAQTDNDQHRSRSKLAEYLKRLRDAKLIGFDQQWVWLT